MTTLAIVDSLPAATIAASAPNMVLASDNPLLAHDRRAGAAIENMDALIPQREAARLGALALDLTAAVERRLAAADAAAEYGLEPGYVSVMGVVSRLVAGTLHRGAAMARVVARVEPDEVALYLVDAPRWEPGQPFLPPRFAHPARALGELGFFAPRPASFTAVAAPLPATVNDTAVRSFAARALVPPLATSLFEALDRARLLPAARGRVLVGEENETVREALPWIALHGVKPVRKGKQCRGPVGPTVTFRDAVETDPWVEGALGDLVQEGIEAASAFSGDQRHAIGQLLLQHLSAGLRHLGAQVEALRRDLDSWHSGGESILLSNGLFGPAGAQSYGLYRARGLRIVECEHGVTAGISALTDRKLELAGPPPADRLLVCSDRARRVFVSARRATSRPEIVAVGLPDQVRRTLRRPFQRWLARRRLGIASSEAVVMHVSTLPHSGNHRPGLAAPTETTIWSLERALLESVYPGLRHRVVFKPYPTQRFPHEPDYPDRYEIASNITFTGDEDFRYVRAAADVLVTMTPTSTLGWAIGAGVPLVWLDTRELNPLSDDEVGRRFRDSFLWVDLDKAGWQGRLRAMLARGLPEILGDWRIKAESRAALCRDVLTGPPGSVGRRVADVVLALRRAGTPEAMAVPSRERAT
jgi:hypothetical protein